MKFTGPFVTEDLPHNTWRIILGYSFIDSLGLEHKVKDCTVTDGASIPFILWPLVGHPRSTNIGQAAGLHDVLYVKGFVSRKRSDQLLVEGMETLGAGWLKRKLVYAGIRSGGFVAWNRYRKRQLPAKEKSTAN